MKVKISTDQGFIEVEAEDIVYIEGIKCFAHFDAIDGWVVSEWACGLRVACWYDDSACLDEVIALANDRVKSTGLEKTNRLIARAIEQHGRAND